MKIKSINQFIEHSVQDLYSAENQLIAALEELSEKAVSPELKEALDAHREETETHATRLEEIAEMLEIDPNGEDCIGIKGVIQEGKHTLENIEATGLIDNGIIGGGQRAEHYEMAGYMALIREFELMENEDVVKILKETLKEEMAADKKLDEIARKNGKL